MSIEKKQLSVLFVIIMCAGYLPGCGSSGSGSGDGGVPDGSSPDSGVQPAQSLVWVQVTDDHQSRGSCNDKGHFAAWLSALTYIRTVINPDFVVNTGDLADNECPQGQKQADWDDYHNGVVDAGYTSANYYDLVGNHDAHEDPSFSGFLNNSISGADGQTMHAWTRQSGPFTYAFIATLTSTSGEVGGYFLQPAYNWTKSQLEAANNDTGIFVFAHHANFELFSCISHPLDVDTGLFVTGGLLDTYRVTSFVGGHVHRDCEKSEWNSYTITTYNEYLGEENSPPDHSGRMRIFVLTRNIWANRPKYVVDHGSQVIITFPQDQRLAVPRSPNGHEVTGKTTITAMAFGSTPANLQMAVDNGTPIAMTSVDNRTYFAQFDFGTVAAGTHTILVNDLNNTDTTNGQDTITVVSH